MSADVILDMPGMDTDVLKTAVYVTFVMRMLNANMMISCRLIPAPADLDSRGMVDNAGLQNYKGTAAWTPVSVTAMPAVQGEEGFMFVSATKAIKEMEGGVPLLVIRKLT
jgi:hypothetical protein